MVSKAHSNLSIIEAVETLSNIADLEFDQEMGIAQPHELVLQNEKINYKTVHWLHQRDATAAIRLVKETFRVILHYLRQFYRKEYGYVTDPGTIEGIKTIMVLVGEAAKKLDKYTHLFQQTHPIPSVTELKEYKQLQEFYLTRIAKNIDEGVLGKWILGLSLNQRENKKLPQLKIKQEPSKITETKHVFVDLETVKKDTEYELFFVRKEDGSRFFSPRLLRNIKLVCDFGSYFGEQKERDPLENLAIWQDQLAYNYAKNIIRSIGSRLDYFYHELRKVKNHELVDILSKALLALLLSSQSRNSLQHHPIKSCGEYFADFQSFLRQALQHKLYQRWIAYPPQKSNRLAYDLIDLVQTLCRAFYLGLHGTHHLQSLTQELIEQATKRQSIEHQLAAEQSKSLWSAMGGDYAAMTRLIRHHPNGPLLKVLNILEEGAYHVFDSWMQHNLPDHLFDLYIHDKRIAHLRIGSPISQEFINKASIIEEFKGFLRSYAQQDSPRHHLLINMQDRTSWREHARCEALEELQKQEEFKQVLTVVTVPFDTDFYNQLAPYHQINHVETFLEQFKEHLLSDHSGFYFPPVIKSQLTEKNFISQTLKQIHQLFFSNKNVLTREQRLNFIEIFYLFLELKLIDLVQPDSFSFTCKDGIDVGEANSVRLFAFLKLLSSEHVSLEDKIYLNTMLYAPAIFIRERIMLPDRFNRLLSGLRVLETVYQEMGRESFAKALEIGLKSQFKTDILKAMALIPR